MLAGGRSRRMGRDKATLPFGGQTMLARIVATVSGVVDEVRVVVREGQEIAGGYDIARDPAEGHGPLAGIRAGLAAVHAERAFVVSCDMPLLRAEYVAHLLALSRGFEVAVPEIDGHRMVTSAVYAQSLLPIAVRLLAEGRRRPLDLIDAATTRIVGEAELRTVDPELDSLHDCNTPEAVDAALSRAGLAPSGMSHSAASSRGRRNGR